MKDLGLGGVFVGDQVNLVCAGESGTDSGECVGEVVEVLLNLMMDCMGEEAREG